MSHTQQSISPTGRILDQQKDNSERTPPPPHTTNTTHEEPQHLRIRGGGPHTEPPLPHDSTITTDQTPAGSSINHVKLTWLNIRGVRSKDELLVRTANEQQWPLIMLTETKLKREREKLFCGDQNEYSWILGAASRITRQSAPGKGGVGALVHASIRGAIHKLDSTRDQLWLQLDAPPKSDAADTGKYERPTFIGVVYLPTGTTPSARAECQRIYEEVAMRVQRYQSQGTVLLGGDMNARLSANGDTTTNAAGAQLAEFAQRHGLLIGNTQLPLQIGDTRSRCTGTFSRSELHADTVQQSTLDYVLVSKSSQARLLSLTIDESVPHRVLSDHKPLVVEWRCRSVTFEDLPPPAAPRVRWRVDDITADRKAKARMQRGMHSTMSAWCCNAREWMSSDEYSESSPELKVTALLGSWEYELTCSLADTIGAKLVNTKAKSWVRGGELVDLIRNRDTLRQECEHAYRRKRTDGSDSTKETSTDEEWNSLALRALHAQREVRKEIHRRKKRQREETFASVELEWSHPKLFFRRVHEMRSDGTAGMSAPVLKTQSGELVSDLASRLETTRLHYAELGTDERALNAAASEPTDDPATPAEEFIEAEPEVHEFDSRFASLIESRVNEMARESLSETIGPLDAMWTADELALALTRLRNGKAPGADHIHSEFLRYGGKQLQHAMLILFNEILQCEYWPDRWRLGLICPIYKRTGNESELDNYRPITLLSIVSKLFEILLNTRLMEWAESNRILSDEQGGFRTKRGCADQLFVLKEVWSSRRERKLQTFAAFLDVKSAYDRVWRTGLWHELFTCGVRGKAWRMLRAMYTGMKRSVLVDGQRTATFPVDVGVSQGSVLSPFLYSVFIDGLIRALKADGTLGVELSNEQLVGLLYADDIVLLAPSPVVLQRMLDVTSEYARQWRFHFNGRKSQIVVQGTKQQITDARAAPPMYRLDGHFLSVVSEYKYLGMETGLPPSAAPCKSFGLRLVRATTNRAHDILLAGCEMNQLDPRCSSRLWHALCRPILEYGSEVWVPNTGQRKRFAQTQSWFARRVLGCHQGTPGVFATSELGMRSLDHRREQYHLRFWYRLCAALPDRLLHRVFRQRVADVKRSPESTRDSLCYMLHTTLMKYDLDDEWDRVGTDQMYEAEEWTAKVDKAVRDEETNARSITLALRSTLDTYAAALVPKLGCVAPYLLHSRNREGAWIQCRLRSETLPLMTTLSRQCYPPRGDAYSACPICPVVSHSNAVTASLGDDAATVSTTGAAVATPPTAEVESVQHFVSSCSSTNSIDLRRDLCCRLLDTISQWQLIQRQAWSKQWKGPIPLTGPDDPTLLERSLKAALTNGVQFITATINAMSLQSATTAAVSSKNDIDRAWCQLILGRSTDPITGNEWNSTLLTAIQRVTQNYLLVLWRARATRLGGVPTLLTGGRGVSMEPYARMKSIGLRHVTRRPLGRTYERVARAHVDRSDHHYTSHARACDPHHSLSS